MSPEFNFTYDALGRVTNQTTNGRTLLSGFDLAGDRTSWQEQYSRISPLS